MRNLCKHLAALAATHPQTAQAQAPFLQNTSPAASLDVAPAPRVPAGVSAPRCCRGLPSSTGSANAPVPHQIHWATPPEELSTTWASLSATASERHSPPAAARSLPGFHPTQSLPSPPGPGHSHLTPGPEAPEYEPSEHLGTETESEGSRTKQGPQDSGEYDPRHQPTGLLNTAQLTVSSDITSSQKYTLLKLLSPTKTSCGSLCLRISRPQFRWKINSGYQYPMPLHTRSAGLLGSLRFIHQ